MPNIEVEIRTFLTQEKYNELIEFFKKEADFLNEDNQTTYYFDCEEDLRIQKNEFFSKIWMKKGKIHDDFREELEIKFDKENFEMLEKLFLSLGYNVEIKWFRKRHSFTWNGISVTVDFTEGYGYILELEKMSSEESKEEALNFLKQKLKELNLEETPKEEFKKKYDYYKNNWRNLIQSKP